MRERHVGESKASNIVRNLCGSGIEEGGGERETVMRVSGTKVGSDHRRYVQTKGALRYRIRVVRDETIEERRDEGIGERSDV